jgi:hypothetical protein
VLRCSNMKIPNKLPKSEAAILGRGGQEAINYFLERSQRLHELGLVEALRAWVKLAAPALPDEERAEVMVLLMYGFLYMHYRAPKDVVLNRLH